MNESAKSGLDCMRKKRLSPYSRWRFCLWVCLLGERICPKAGSRNITAAEKLLRLMLFLFSGPRFADGMYPDVKDRLMVGWNCTAWERQKILVSGTMGKEPMTRSIP